MSGPKKSSYEIRQEIYQQRKAEQRAKREKQINEIENELRDIRDEISNLQNKYGQISDHISDIANSWIRDIKDNIHGDLRECWKGINGIKKYITTQSKTLQLKQKKINQKILQEEKIKQQELLKQNKIDRVVESLEAIQDDYKEILNDGILQRIKIFQESIKTNPDNPNTLKQIKNFKSTLLKEYEKYQEKQEDTNYVAGVFSNILNSNIQKKGDGSIEISGSIEGVPISVKLNNTTNSIDLDTPTDGTCQKGLQSLQNRLNNFDIDLGAIKVLKTGQILNNNKPQNRQRGVKA